MSCTQKYQIKGLTCAHCANAIETKLNAIDDIDKAHINFAQGLLVLQTQDAISQSLIKKIQNTIFSQEPRASIEPLEQTKSKTQNMPWKKHILTPRFLGFVLGVLLFIGAFFVPQNFNLILFLLAYALIGGEILVIALKNLIKGKVFDENFLMSIATIGAFSIGEYPEGVAVMLFYRIGEFFQDLAVDRSRSSISALMDIRPESATLITPQGYKSVLPQDVKIGDHILVKPGEKIPLDGIVLDGRSSLDTTALTGESVPQEVTKGSSVLSGSINLTGVLSIKTTTLFSQSTVAKIFDLVQNASSKKAKTEQFITSFAKVYTPSVVGIAAMLAILPPLLFESASFDDWLGRALVFLVVSCPCALVISIPLSFFGGIGGASKRGILVKGANFLETLRGVKTVVFDKTGTLSEGVFRLQSIHPQENFNKDELLEIAAKAERHSNHPIARSIVQAYQKEFEEDNGNYEELAGFGVKAEFDGMQVLVGNHSLMQKEKIAIEPIKANQSVAYVAIDGKFAGALCVADMVKKEGSKTIQELKKLGIKRIVMLTGDTLEAAEDLAKSLGITEVYAKLLPHQKVEKLEMILKDGKSVFVGDGINDAPVLARADVGIAMGGVGSDAAIEAADIVIMDDNLDKIPSAISIARKTHRIVWQNIIFALGVKGVILVLGAFGIAGMWEAVFGDVGVALLAILNASRVLR